MRALVIVLVAACVPKSAADQAKAAKDVAGEVDGSLVPVSKKGSVAQAANSRMQLQLKDVSDGAACMIYTEYKPVMGRETARDVDAAVAELERSASSLVLVAGASESLDKFQWPDQSRGVKGKLVEAKRVNKPYEDADGQRRDSYYVDYTVQWCPPLPAISTTSKYFTVSMFQAGKEAPSLFVWRIKGTPVVSAGTQPSTEPTSSEPTSSEPSSKPATTTGNTVVDWLRKKSYTKFLELVAAAGMEAELSASGVIVFAAYDTLFTSSFDELVKDKARAKAFIDDSIVDGTLTKDQLIDKGSVTLQTRSGKKVVLTYDAKKQRPFLDGAKLDRQVIETSNGTIFIRDTMIR